MVAVSPPSTRVAPGVKLNESESISRYEAGVSFRGGTVQFLHVSEWGWIQANDPARSKAKP